MNASSVSICFQETGKHLLFVDPSPNAGVSNLNISKMTFFQTSYVLHL